MWTRAPLGCRDFPLFHVIWSTDQVAQGHAYGVGDAEEHGDGRVCGAVLDPQDVQRTDARLFGELLLGEVGVQACVPDAYADSPPSFDDPVGLRVARHSLTMARP